MIASPNKQRVRLGPLGQKVVLLLVVGAALSLTRRPDQYFRIIKYAAKDWRRINQRSLHEAIKRLYQSHLIDYREDRDGTVQIILEEEGKKRALQYNLDKMKITTPSKWDGFWRIFVFDIPEYKKKARDAFASKIKYLGLYPLQKSVFVHPFDCQEEIEFLAEFFEVKPHVRFIIAKDIDNALHLKKKFKLN